MNRIYESVRDFITDQYRYFQKLIGYEPRQKGLDMIVVKFEEGNVVFPERLTRRVAEVYKETPNNSDSKQ